MKFYVVAILLILLSLVFWYQPGIDYQVSNFFYDAQHQSFWAETTPYLKFIRQIIIKSLMIMNIALGLVLVLKIIKPEWVRNIKAKAAIYVLLCFVIAPGLVVNALLKDHWGRPRPHQIQAYGGAAIYQPVWKISSQCDRNCSFVCGDCAMVFTLFAFVPLTRRKYMTTIMVCFAGVGISLLRVGAGGHFMSDALFSGVIVYLVVNGIYHVLYSNKRFDEASFEEFFSQLHKKLVRKFV